MSHKKLILLVICLIFLLGSICGYIIMNRLETSRSFEVDISSLNAKDDEVNWSVYKVQNINLTESLTITTEGVYHLAGTLQDGHITINTRGNVKLLFDNISIISSNSPSIYVENSKVLVLETVKDTKNYLEDGSSYASSYGDIDGAIFSKDDLYLQGEGALEIKANHGDGIVSKDDLKVNSGTYVITSADDGIRGKDSVYIKNGNFTITSTGDGIKSTNEKDNSKGYIYIENGVFTIDSIEDGIQAIRQLEILDGKFDIKTGGGSSNARTKAGWDNWNSKSTSNESSAKGLKSDYAILISGGTFHLNTSDDSIHSNNFIHIKDGVFEIISGDDGIHANTELIINQGTIDIQKSYEGLESVNIIIQGGTISIISSDDGINVSDGNDSSNIQYPGANNIDTRSDHKLVIYDGKITVNATGDGIDVNGSGYVYGGTVVVYGPTSDGDGPLDYDGEFIVDGGVFIAVGSQGMLQGISNNSKQNNLIAYLDTVSEGSTISIINPNGEEIITVVSPKSVASLTASSDKLTMNDTYKILVDGEEIKIFTISSTTTEIGSKRSERMNGEDMSGGRGMR